jgi:hypothetical protein
MDLVLDDQNARRRNDLRMADEFARLLVQLSAPFVTIVSSPHAIHSLFDRGRTCVSAWR